MTLPQPAMKELACPSCGHRNPDIRELGYKLPLTCGRCPHIWRLQDLGPIEGPKTRAEALARLVAMGMLTEEGNLTEQYGGAPMYPSQEQS